LWALCCLDLCCSRGFNVSHKSKSYLEFYFICSGGGGRSWAQGLVLIRQALYLSHLNQDPNPIHIILNFTVTTLTSKKKQKKTSFNNIFNLIQYLWSVNMSTYNLI
jgi:hypothetical protein